MRQSVSPCKRELRTSPDREKFQVTEYYSEIKLDQPVDLKLFELPK